MQLLEDFAALAPSLDAARPRVKQLFYKGNLELLKLPKIAVVGSRECLSYTQSAVKNLCVMLRNEGICVVSGGALGADIYAHTGALPLTIGVFANALDEFYPRQNKAVIEQIYTRGLALSEANSKHIVQRGDFLLRNRIIIALSDALVVAQADFKSGSMSSVKLAQKLGKPIFALPHRLGESEATNALVARGEAGLIDDFARFCKEFKARFGFNGGLFEGEFEDKNEEASLDPLLKCVAAGVEFDELFERFGEAVYDYELEGKILIEGVKVRLA